ncbi:NAD-dependent epimerase/dehydratase family protein [Paenibacillus aestuarii]|uniref:NAD-dependent epimerase/dehydratase family protein n=1 Tax=Paenibacillus aestuarii TaxID=516965 RepID=A0ABW0KJS4_9BACL|nr:NAD-dependent epimerase/dehydratase family protein [Paenibacillus aestuarii]
MKLLILGGTKFLGRAIAQAAWDQGHEVTLFHRGQHDASIFPEMEHIIGDRDGQLAKLQGKRWDAVVDTSGYLPRIVGDSARFLQDKVDHYTFISSISVYEDLTQIDVDEHAAVAQLPEGSSLDEIGHNYGALKALCEQAVQEVMQGRTLVIRPGLIVGPHDASDRFTYWPARIQRGGEVLVPLPRERSLQFIDVRDLAAWIVRLIENKTTGTIHTSGSDYTMEELVETCARVSQVKPALVWVDEQFLIEQGVGEWMELPLWIRHDSLIGMMHVDNTKAKAAGLTTRPLTETARDTLAWDHSRPLDTVRKAGLDPKREEELLQRWRNHDGGE